jgi:GNAT superfamily N-acetyltransferase
LAEALSLVESIAHDSGGEIDAFSFGDQLPGRRTIEPNASLFMAWHDAGPCGLLAGGSLDGHTFDLGWGGVLPEHRGRGLGMALLQETERAASASGMSLIRCSVGGDRRPEMRLLMAFGMKVIGVWDDHPGQAIRVIFRKTVGDPILRRTSSDRDLNVTIEPWPIKRLCELEHIYQAGFGDLLDDGHPILDEMVLLDATYENYLHVALVNDEPVGFKQAQERTRGVLHSHIGAVHPDARGAGIASKLMIAQHDFAKSNGFGGIATRSRNRYPQMIRLNLKHGFQIVGVVQALGEPAIHMFKRLK